MRNTWLKEEGIPRANRRHPVGIPGKTLARDYMIELPLCTVGMIGAHGFARGYAADLDVEGVPLEEVGRLGLPAESQGKILVRGCEHALG